MTLKHAAHRCARANLFHRQLSTPEVRPLHTTSPQPLKSQDSPKSNLNQNQKSQATPSEQDEKRQPVPSKAKTVSQADAELRERLEQMSGEGGASGIEYEDGKPNAMKRGVRNNMFRLI